MWFHKSKGNWITNGDRNKNITSRRLFVQRRMNKVIVVRDENKVGI